MNAKGRQQPSNQGLGTKAVHAGQPVDAATGAVTLPIHLSTTFAHHPLGTTRGYEYSRSGNPTRAALEASLAELECARYGIAFSSGLAAITAVAMLAPEGSHVVLEKDVYGGTWRLFSEVFSRYGITITTVDMRNPGDLAAAITKSTSIIWLESPTNPLLHVIDLASVSRIGRAAHALVCVDNTFATPVGQNPLQSGADIVVHSTTKFLGGHSDVVGGAILTNHPGLAERLHFLQNATGAVPSPFDCWLLLRGIKTLELRILRQSSTAEKIAAFLVDHPAVSAVHYPTKELRTAAGGALRVGGGVVSFEVANRSTAEALLNHLELFTLAESLGAVESLAEHPASMTHASIPEKTRRTNGITDGLIRLSVGIEDPDDLISDLEQALEHARSATGQPSHAVH